METIHLIIICGTALLAILLFTLFPFLAKKFEIKQKNKIEIHRNEVHKDRTDFSNEKEKLSNELEERIKASLGKDISKLVNDKIDATLAERIKTLEEQIKLLAIKTKK